MTALKTSAHFASFPITPEKETHTVLTCTHTPYKTFSSSQIADILSAPVVSNALSSEDANSLIKKFTAASPRVSNQLHGIDVIIAKRTIDTRDAMFNGRDSKDFVGALHGMLCDVSSTRDYDNESYLSRIAGGAKSLVGAFITQGHNAMRISNAGDIRELFRNGFELGGVAFAEDLDQFAQAVRDGKVENFDCRKNYLVIPRKVRSVYSKNIDIICDKLEVIYDEESDYGHSPSWYLRSWAA